MDLLLDDEPCLCRDSSQKYLSIKIICANPFASKAGIKAVGTYILMFTMCMAYKYHFDKLILEVTNSRAADILGEEESDSDEEEDDDDEDDSEEDDEEDDSDEDDDEEEDDEDDSDEEDEENTCCDITISNNIKCNSEDDEYDSDSNQRQI